ncbi:hypothetical protein V6N12_050667 [Hibiscus sabdariffa]|uniref:Uncharacterized protein n=1 Tax=Hibiscus sabdariffa TaxID=183260 RepID=A0ABR2GD55_9ROSI
MKQMDNNVKRKANLTTPISFFPLSDDSPHSHARSSAVTLAPTALAMTVEYSSRLNALNWCPKIEGAGV